MINFEEGGERAIMHGDATSEAFLTEVLGTRPWPGKRHMNVESMFEYGSRAGFWRLWRLFTARKLPATVFGVATALARNPQIVAAMREAKWDIASHGLKWIDYRDFTCAEEGEHFREAIRIHTEATGERPLGWYTGRTTEHTLKLVLEDGGFVYSSDSYADDLLYWVKRTRGARTSSSPTRSTPTICASSTRRASPTANPSSPICAIPSISSMPKAKRRRK